MSAGHVAPCPRCGRAGFWRYGWGGWPRYEHAEPPYVCWLVAEELRQADPDGLAYPGARSVTVPAGTQLEMAL